MVEACQHCPNDAYCQVKKPITIRGKNSENPVDCVSYTCNGSGREAGYKAMGRKPEPINTPEGTVLATRFGSKDKPTHRSRHFGRFVTEEGIIYAGEIEEDVFYLTGQRI